VGLHAALVREDAGQRDPLMDQGWPAREGHAYFTALLGDPANVGFLAEETAGDEVAAVGFVVGRMGGEPNSLRPVRRASLESMFVQPEHRSHRVGEALVQRFLEWARDQGAEQVAVSAFAANDRAIAFYRRIGFVPRSLELEIGLH